jgi:DNA repair exonuclease SbcCD ATPase subunit
MSKWEDNYKNHPIHTTLQNLNEALDDETLVSDDINISDLVDRIRQAASFANSCLENVLPALTSQGSLNNANSYLQNILNEINRYKANKNIGHLNNTTNHIDTLIAQLSSFPIPRPSVEEDAFSKILISFKEQSENIIKLLSKKKQQLEVQLNELSNASSDVGQQFGQLLSSVNQQGKDIEKTISEFESRFEELKEKANQDLKNEFEENINKIEQLIEEVKNQHSSLMDEQKSDADRLLSILESKRKEASDLVQIIGNIGITGNYQKIANQEKEAADRWRNISLLLMLGMVGAIALTIFVSVENGFDWKLSIFRLMAALVLIIPATYAAKESSRHRALENHNRRAELELASLDPYLEKLPEEMRNQIKENLTEKFFGLEDGAPHPDEPVTYNSLLEIIKMAIKGK